MLEGGDDELPPEIVLSDPRNYDVWVMYVALGRRFLPSQILDEPLALLNDIIALDSAYNSLDKRRQQAEQKG